MPDNLIASRGQPALPLGFRVRSPSFPAGIQLQINSPACQHRPCQSSPAHARSPSPARNWRSQPSLRRTREPGRPPCWSPRSPPRRSKVCRQALRGPSGSCRPGRGSAACRPPISPPRRTFGGCRLPITLLISRLRSVLTGTVGDMTCLDSRSRRNRASRRGGQLPTRALRSSSRSACPHFRAPGASVRDGRTIRRRLDARSGDFGAASLIPVTNDLERLERRDQAPRRGRRASPTTRRSSGSSVQSCSSRHDEWALPARPLYDPGDHGGP